MKDALSTKSRIGSPNVCMGRVVFNNIKDFKADSDTYDQCARIFNQKEIKVFVFENCLQSEIAK